MCKQLQWDICVLSAAPSSHQVHKYPYGATCDNIDYNGSLFPQSLCDAGYAVVVEGQMPKYVQIGGLTTEQAKSVCCRQVKVEHTDGTARSRLLHCNAALISW